MKVEHSNFFITQLLFVYLHYSYYTFIFIVLNQVFSSFTTSLFTFIHSVIGQTHTRSFDYLYLFTIYILSLYKSKSKEFFFRISEKVVSRFSVVLTTLFTFLTINCHISVSLEHTIYTKSGLNSFWKNTIQYGADFKIYF